jgi:dual oxidase
MLLIKSPSSYDMVLEFDSEPSRRRFLTRLEKWAAGLRKSVEMAAVYRTEMLQAAETEERRQRKLETFFREAYGLTFGVRYVLKEFVRF